MGISKIIGMQVACDTKPLESQDDWGTALHAGKTRCKKSERRQNANKMCFLKQKTTNSLTSRLTEREYAPVASDVRCK